LASRLHGVLYVILLSILIYVSWELPFFSSKNIIIVLGFTIFLEILILTRINHLYTTSHKQVLLFFAKGVFPIAKAEFPNIKSGFTFGNWYISLR